jgi:DNA repair exonuclease SbcCD ATPase subunit
MKMISFNVENFCSYKNLEMDFDGKGLVLVQGPTGSGKSTICDAPMWLTFGTTAKDGNADDVKSWFDNKLVTKGSISYEIQDKIIYIHRTRGNNQNDLYYTISPNIEPMRGINISDTQNKINNILGVTSDMYAIASYFHEFSKVANFFTSNAKNRRLILENFIDLSFPTTLTDKIAKKLKENKNILEPAITALDITNKDIIEKERQKIEIATKAANFDSEIKTKIQLIEKSKKDDLKQYEEKKAKTKILYDEYEDNLTIKLAEIEEKQMSQEICDKCNTPKRPKEYKELQIKKETLLKTVNPYTFNQNKPNLDQYDLRIKDLKNQQNPYINTLNFIEKDIIDKKSKIQVLKETIKTNEIYKNNLETLKDCTLLLRKKIIEQSLILVEDVTNEYLSEYFDGDLRVSFKAEDLDKIDVQIFKDGNSAIFTQLSKGQRQLLKLCFSLACMKVINQHHSFNTVFFDEALDGLSDELKIKSYRLFETLALQYDNVFVVEHNESLKSMFHNKYNVILKEGYSVLNEES